MAWLGHAIHVLLIAARKDVDADLRRHDGSKWIATSPADSVVQARVLRQGGSPPTMPVGVQGMAKRVFRSGLKNGTVLLGFQACG
jgi:hypothetical protein